jgi:phosphoribulokinase
VKPRPILLGVVGDSAAGKTTITRGLVRILGEDTVTHVCTDDYHRYDRGRRAELGITPLHPECNYLDIMTQDLRHLRAGDPILKPVYRHHDGTFGPPEYIAPERFTIVEGLLGYHTEELRSLYDVRVFLAPPEDLRRRWKVRRDCSRRGYTTDQVLTELDRREDDSAAFIRPQARHADLIVAFQPNAEDAGDQAHLDVELTIRDRLPHPDLSLLSASDETLSVRQRGSERVLRIPGSLEQGHATEIEEAIWQRMHFASHLRTRRLGEFTIGTELFRSDSLAIVQLLILYHLVTAKASVALGGDTSSSETGPVTSSFVG